MYKLLLTLILGAVISVTTGCWDRIEIEDIGFVIGAGIDMGEENDQGQQQYKLTQQFVVPGALQGQGGGTNGGGADEAHLNIESTGMTMFEMIREVAARTSRSPFYEHIKIIVISEEVARSEGFPELLDFFIRYPEMRRGVQVLITPGKASDILGVKPKNEKLPIMYIQSISKNNFKNARMLPPSRLGDIHEELLKKQSFMIQKVEVLSPKEVKIIGNALIQGHTDKLVGYLGPDETEGANFITGEVRGGLIQTTIKNKGIVYDINQAKSEVKASMESVDAIKFTVSINVLGTIPETFVNLDFLDEEVIKDVEKKVEERVREFAQMAIDKLQNELKVDVLKLGNALENQHPKEWEKVKDDWDYGANYFSKSKIEVKVSVKIRGTDAILRSTLE